MSVSTTPIPLPLSGMEATLGKELMNRINSSNILMVGAGGIGCELLKNLALSGFRNLQVIDLDTIDVSNLNRQFLFRSQHVGQAKCHVASAVAKDMAPHDDGVEYTPHHGNVCDNAKFNVPFIQKFDLVLNALDNATARRRVNRLCLAAGVPLIEAGTTGYLGQVTVIDKASQVECFECQPKAAQKVYPICTIRSTPSQPVHTIVWGKELYKLLFGLKAEESMLYDGGGDDDAEKGSYMEFVDRIRLLLMIGEKRETNKNGGNQKWETEVRDAVHDLLVELYVTDINKQLETGRYKTALKTPTPLSTTAIDKGCSSEVTTPTERKDYSHTQVWESVEDCVAQFAACLLEAARPTAPSPSAEFDKDDDMAMCLVTAASNLRSMVFDIQPLQSFHDAKGIAGNIIPAIATTNAIVAGLQVLQVFHILQGLLRKEKSSAIKEKCRYIYCARNKDRRGNYLVPTKLKEPNPQCFVCRSATIPLSLNLAEWNLQRFLDTIIKKELGFGEPTILLDGNIIYEEGEGADTENFLTNLTKSLMNLPCGGIQHGTVVVVEDFSQDLETNICITHREKWEQDPDAPQGQEDDAEKFIVGGERPVVKEASPKAEAKAEAPERKLASKDNSAIDEDSDDDVIEITSGPNGAMPNDPDKSKGVNGRAKKRARNDSSPVQNGIIKRSKTNGQAVEVVEID